MDFSTGSQAVALPDDALRGAASRLMLAEDARWVADMVLSRQTAVRRFQRSFIFLVLHHAVRIVHEGTLAVRSSNHWVGTPELASLVNGTHSDITARIRNLTKLMDDTHASFESVLADLEAAIADQQSRFLGHSLPPVRFLERDTGLYLCDGNLVGTTMTSAYRLGLGRDTSLIQDEILAITKDWGEMIRLLSMAAFDVDEIPATIDWSALKFTTCDKRLRKYGRRRFEPGFPESLKLLLILVEGDMNASLSVLEATRSRHEMPVFRARVVSLYHALTTLRRVAERFPGIKSVSMERLRALLAFPEVSRLVSRQGELVRNRCVHYEMNDPAIIPDLGAPMFGLVEAVFPGMTWAVYNQDVLAITERLSALLHEWVP